MIDGCLEFRFGFYKLFFDPMRGAIQELHYSDQPFLNDLYPAVRDQHWGTLSLAHVAYQIHQPRGGDLSIEWSPCAVQNGLEWADLMVTILTSEAGVEYRLRVRAVRDFSTCRTGLCVHHNPSVVAGENVRVEHPDGTESTGHFPTLISPHQPFRQIQALEHSVDGARVRFEFFGEVFEMEDQRNWLDFSFKTYCRPQDLPKPYALTQGEVVEQRIKISGEMSLAPLPPLPDQSRATVRVKDVSSLGLFEPSYTLWSDFDDTVEQFESALASIVEEDPCPLIWLVGDPEDRLRVISSLGVLPLGIVIANYEQHADSLAGWRERDPSFRFIAGSPSNFTELNRNQPSSEWDGVAFAVSPVVHQIHPYAILQTIHSWSAQVKTARSWGFSEIHFGPVTIPSRYPMFKLLADGVVLEQTVVSRSFW